MRRCQAEDGQEQAGVILIFRIGGGRFWCSRPDEPDRRLRKVTICGAGMRSGPGMRPQVGDVADPVDLVIDRPVAADAAGRVLRCGLAG